MTWFLDLGFEKNPLDIRPNPDLVGLEKEESQLINHIKKEEICFLNGLTGSGKTSLLYKVQKELSDHKFIYLDAQDLPKDFDLEGEIKKQRSFFDRIFLKDAPSKKPVLIIDEFQATDPELILEARGKWENNDNRKIKSIVIAQISKYLRNVTPAFKERLGSRIITLRTLDEEEMKEIVRRRLYNRKKGTNYADKISEEALSFIVKCSGGNPRRMLEYVDELFDFHYRKFGDLNPIKKESYKISFYGAREILGLEKVNVSGFDAVDDEKPGAKNGKEAKYRKKASVHQFDRIYSKKEKKVLRFLLSPKTIDEIAKMLNVSKGSAIKVVSGLKAKKGVMAAGKKGRKKLWQTRPETRRMMVKV